MKTNMWKPQPRVRAADEIADTMTTTRDYANSSESLFALSAYLGIKSGSGDLSSKGDRAIPAHILEYGHRESIAYIAAMSPTTYSAVRNVLEEVNRRVPDLDPKTILDFGTGPGTAIWYVFCIMSVGNFGLIEATANISLFVILGPPMRFGKSRFITQEWTLPWRCWRPQK